MLPLLELKGIDDCLCEFYHGVLKFRTLVFLYSQNFKISTKSMNAWGEYQYFEKFWPISCLPIQPLHRIYQWVFVSCFLEQNLEISQSLWSYHYGNLGLVTYSGVQVTFPSCSISSFNHRKSPKMLGNRLIFVHQIHIVSLSFKIIWKL